MKYTVTSDRLPFERGSTVTDEQLEGVNVAALVAGGHLKKTTGKAPAKPSKGT